MVGKVNDDLERIQKDAVLAYSSYCPGICLEGLRKTTKEHRQDSRSLASCCGTRIIVGNFSATFRRT
jgi:hypothetical protein